MSNRIDKVNELLRQLLAGYFSREVEFPAGALVTIIKVETTKDLQFASVWLSVWPVNQRGRVLALLGQAGPDIHQYLCNSLSLRRIPRPHFRIDDTEEKAAEVEKIINHLHRQS